MLCEILKVFFEIPCLIFNPYTAKYASYDVLKFDELRYLRIVVS